MPTVDFFGYRVRGQHPERVFDLFVQVPLILLYGQNIIGLFGDDLLGDTFLATHRIDGHHRSAQLQRVEQLGNRRDFIGFFVDAAPAPDCWCSPRRKPYAQWPACPVRKCPAALCRRWPPLRPPSAWQSTIPRPRSPFPTLPDPVPRRHG